VGVTFFSYMSVKLLAIYELEASGMGRFRPRLHKVGVDYRGHILVMGGGVTAGSATLIEPFLKALCRDSTSDIVLLSQTACSDPVSARAPFSSRV